MIAKGRSPLRAYIEDTGEYLSYLLDMYPTFLDKWISDKENECQNIAKDSSDGDCEIENSIFNSLFQGFCSFGETEVFFYDAMFIMIYSYYESVIMKLSQKYGCDNRPSAICKHNHNHLSDTATKHSSFLYDNVRILRNQFCHNFLGTIGARKEEDKQVVESLIHQYPDAIITDDTSIHIVKNSFVAEILSKEGFVIKEMIDKLNI